MATNDFKAFATGNGANVTSQADYNALPALTSGFTSGKASSAQINKAIRQATTMASLLGQFVSDKAGVDVLDNGNTSMLLNNFIDALKVNSANDFLQKKNNLSEITTPAAKASARSNLGLGNAAVATIGTGANQLPDINSFSSSLLPVGYQKIPSGLIFQWGVLNPGGSSGSISFPLQFPNRALNVVASADTTIDAGVASVCSANVSALSSSNFTYIIARTVSGNQVLFPKILYWFATGY